MAFMKNSRNGHKLPNFNENGSYLTEKEGECFIEPVTSGARYITPPKSEHKVATEFLAFLARTIDRCTSETHEITRVAIPQSIPMQRNEEENREERRR
jgi:hypothetical protein